LSIGRVPREAVGRAAREIPGSNPGGPISLLLDIRPARANVARAEANARPASTSQADGGLSAMVNENR